MMEAAPERILSYHSVTKDFGALRALNGVDLEIKRGEIFGFIGPDGAGKTTMTKNKNKKARKVVDNEKTKKNKNLYRLAAHRRAHPATSYGGG